MEDARQILWEKYIKPMGLNITFYKDNADENPIEIVEELNDEMEFQVWVGLP